MIEVEFTSFFKQKPGLFVPFFNFKIEHLSDSAVT